MASYPHHSHHNHNQGWQQYEEARSVSPNSSSGSGNVRHEPSPQNETFQVTPISWHMVPPPQQIHHIHHQAHPRNSYHPAIEDDRMVTDKETGPPPQHHPVVVEGHGLRSRRRPRVVRSWSFEILAVILAAGLLAAIYVILGKYNGQQTSSWTPSINLNTLVATLSTISRIALATVASEIISQAKWSWFRSPAERPRTKGVPLHDMEAFDQASRGLWGSALLLPKALRRPDVLVPLVVLLVSVAMGPFAQQAVRTVDCRDAVDDGAASLPNIHALGNLDQNRVFREATLGQEPVTRKVKAAIISSLSDPTADDSVIRPTCPTGNCTFPLMTDDDGQLFTHRSVGFCSRCMDISSILQRNVTLGGATGRAGFQDAYTWTLPNGQFASQTVTFSRPAAGWINETDASFFVVSTDTLSINSSTSPAPEQAAFLKASRYAVINSNFISIDSYNSDTSSPGTRMMLIPNPNVSATTCTLYPCLKTYRANVIRTNFTEDLVSNKDLTPYGDQLPISVPDRGHQGEKQIFPSDMISVSPPCIVDGVIYSSENISLAPKAATLRRGNYGDQPPFTRTFSTLNQTMPMVNITAPPGCFYAMDVTGWFQDVRHLLTFALEGSCGNFGMGTASSTVGLCQQRFKANATTPHTGTDSVNPFWLEGMAALKQRTPADISTFMESVADSITRKFRTGILDVQVPDKATYPWNVTAVQGRAWRSTTCFEVDWRWLLLPTILTGLTALVLAWTVVRGLMTGQVVWKASVLPLMYYRHRLVFADGTSMGSANMDHSEEGPLMEVKEMEKDAKKVEVMFRG